MYDLERIKLELSSLPDFDTQIYLQGNSPDMDPFGPTNGDNYLYADVNEELYEHPLFHIPYINSIIEEHDLVRTRVMHLKPKTGYYWHKDATHRIHIPVRTDPSCFLVFEDGVIHLPADGSWYDVDTTKYHSALNGSKIIRTHIVGCKRV